MRKKIGIITFQDSANFGSALQTYGLWYKINELGYDCEIIDYICEKIKDNELPHKTSWRDLRTPKKVILNLLFRRFYYRKHDNINIFLKNNAKLSACYDIKTIKKTNNIYNHFVVGSDIVWGLSLTNDYTYFLDFVDKKNKKDSFASSVGDPLTLEEKMKIAPLLNDFMHINVREQQSKEWLQDICNKNIDVVCDPTMLLMKEQWIKFVGKRIIKRNYVLVYFNSKDDKCLKDAIKYAKKNNLEVYFINYGIQKSKFKTIRPETIEDFLSLIFYANHVFTASYHGLLFSLYFNVPVLFYNRAHKSRMVSLARMLGITSKNGDEIDIDVYRANDDWKNINYKIADFRNYSITKLKELLNEENI